MWIGYAELIVLMAIFGAVMAKKGPKEVPTPEAAQSASQPAVNTDIPSVSPSEENKTE